MKHWRSPIPAPADLVGIRIASLADLDKAELEDFCAGAYDGNKLANKWLSEAGVKRTCGMRLVLVVYFRELMEQVDRAEMAGLIEFAEASNTGYAKGLGMLSSVDYLYTPKRPEIVCGVIEGHEWGITKESESGVFETGEVLSDLRVNITLDENEWIAMPVLTKTQSRRAALFRHI